jgi:hypothetical protein
MTTALVNCGTDCELQQLDHGELFLLLHSHQMGPCGVIDYITLGAHLVSMRVFAGFLHASLLRYVSDSLNLR